MTDNTSLPVSIAIATLCVDGKWCVDLRVTGLKNEEQAKAAEAHLIRTFCGQEIKVN